MHKLFSAFVLVSDLVLGAIAFAALFTASVPLALKVFLGASLLLVAIHFLSDEILGGMEADVRLETQNAYLWAIFQRLGGQTADWNEAAEAIAKRQMHENQLRGNGRSAIFLTLARFAIWVVIGWLLSSPAFLS